MGRQLQPKIGRKLGGVGMIKRKSKETKEKNMAKPIENQRYAAYYDIKGLQSESRVPIPTLEGVIRAKEWVEENQK